MDDQVNPMKLDVDMAISELVSLCLRRAYLDRDIPSDEVEAEIRQVNDNILLSSYRAGILWIKTLAETEPDLLLNEPGGLEIVEMMAANGDELISGMTEMIEDGNFSIEDALQFRRPPPDGGSY